MRPLNALIMALVASGSLWVYFGIERLLGALGLSPTYVSGVGLWQALMMTLVPRVVMSCVVLGAAGTVLVHLVKSEVPLKWCLALGALCAFLYLWTASAALRRGSPFQVCLILLIAAALALAPVLGGYLAKRGTRARVSR
jgi:hypothetical protein